MARRELGTKWNRKQLDDTNENFKEIYEGDFLKENSQNGNILKDGSVGENALGKESVSREKIQKNAVSITEADFIRNDETVNLFDGVYQNGSVRAGAQGFYLEGTENESYKIAIMSVEANTKYFIKRSLPTRLNIASSTFLLKEKEIFDGKLSLNLSLTGVSHYPQYLELITGSNDKFLYLSMSVDGTEPFLSVSKKPPKNNLNSYSNKLDKFIDAASFNENFEKINLFGGTYETDVAITATNPFKYEVRVGGKTAVFPVFPNTEYTIRRQVPSRFNWATSSKLLLPGENFDGSIQRNDSGLSESTEPEYFTFTTGANDYWLYINNSVTNKEMLLELTKGDYVRRGKIDYDRKRLSTDYDEYIEDVVSSFIPDIEEKSNKIICDFDGQNLMKIFVPSKSTKRYVRYDYQYTSSTNVNFFQWRVQKTYIVDKDFNIIFDLDSQTEWEGAVKEKGAADFMGGTHGDERNVSINLLFDGKEYSFTNGAFKVECSHIRIVNESILNRVGIKEVDLLHRFKISEWTIDNYSVENRYTALESFLIEQSKIVLMSCRYEQDGRILINRGRSDLDFKVQNMSANSIGDLVIQKQGIRKFEVWGPELYLSAEAIADFDKYPNNYQMIQNFNTTDPKRGKIYFDVTGEYQIAKDEQLKSKSIFTVTC